MPRRRSCLDERQRRAACASVSHCRPDPRNDVVSVDSSERGEAQTGKGSQKKTRGCEERETRRKGDTDLSVSAQQFSEKSIRGLIDDWLVPSLVEQFLSDKRDLSDSS